MFTMSYAQLDRVHLIRFIKIDSELVQLYNDQLLRQGEDWRSAIETSKGINNRTVHCVAINPHKH